MTLHTLHGLSPETLDTIAALPRTASMAADVAAAMERAQELEYPLDKTIRNAATQAMQGLSYSDDAAVKAVEDTYALGTQSLGAGVAIAQRYAMPFALVEDISAEEHPIYGSHSRIHILLFGDNSFLVFVDVALNVPDHAGNPVLHLVHNQAGDIAHDVATGNARILVSNAFPGPRNSDMDETLMTALEEITKLFSDAEDPEFNGGEDERCRSDEDEDHARKMAELVFHGIATTNTASLEMYLNSADVGEGFSIQYADGIDPDLYLSILRCLVDESAFTGYSYQYNDGAVDRLSGYSQDGTVFYETFTMQSHSAHALLQEKRAFYTLVHQDDRLASFRPMFKEHADVCA